MFKISLDSYKSPQIYLTLFDLILKSKNINKVTFLENNQISVSTYRRYKMNNDKKGFDIVNKMCEVLKLNLVEDKLLKDYEEKFNEIYNNIYYKNLNAYMKDFDWIELEIYKNNLMFPVLKLFKLFMLVANTNYNLSKFSANEQLYNEVMGYKQFYNNDCLEILLIISTSYRKTNDYGDYENNALLAYSLATNNLYAKDYFKTLYFAEKCRQIMLEEMNLKRLMFLNISIVASYLCLGNYEKAYSIAIKQKYVVASLDVPNVYLADRTNQQLLMASAGLGKYEEAFKISYELEDALTDILLIVLSDKLVKNKSEDNYEFVSENSKNIYDLFKKVLNNRNYKELEGKVVEPLYVLIKYLIQNNKL